jgi:hypothetical protein
MGDNLFRNRRNGRAFWFLLPFLLLLYLLLFPRPGGKEEFIQPVWAKEVSPARAELASQEGPSWFFQAAPFFGYADLQGNLYYVGQRLHNLSLSDSGFINFGSVPDHVIFMNTRGEFQYSIKSYGYPLLDSSGQVMYTINTDRSGLKRIDSDGETLWSMNFAVPLTTIALTGEECVLGLMDGRAFLVDSGGEIIHQQTFDGSRFPIVLGCAVTQDLKQIAIVSGIDPQNLTILQKREEGYAAELSLELSPDFRREIQLQFSRDARFLFFEVPGGLGVLDVRKKTVKEFVIPGVIESQDGSSSLQAAAFRRAEGVQLLIFRPLDSVLLSRRLSSDRVYVKVMGDSLILGLGGRLLRADLLKG